MGIQATHYRRRAQQQMRARGGVQVTYRRITRIDGPDQAVNPPVITGPLTLNGSHLAGVVVLMITATKMRGRVVAGDRFTIAGQTVIASGQAIDNGLHSINVPLTTPLVANLTAGAAVAPVWVGDRLLPARLEDYGERLIDGQMIMSGDQRITLAAADLAADPVPQDQIILDDGRRLTVITVRASRIEGEAVNWVVQAR